MPVTSDTAFYTTDLFGGATGTCRICGRTLTNPDSVQAGIGPVCAGGGTMNTQHEEQDGFTTGFIPGSPPETVGVILQRSDRETKTNIPSLIVYHSPAGFEWGYAGSGPADLALNIAEYVLRKENFEGSGLVESPQDGRKCFTESWLMHQELKARFIAGVPEHGGVYNYEQIRQWVLDQAYSDKQE